MSIRLWLALAVVSIASGPQPVFAQTAETAANPQTAQAAPTTQNTRPARPARPAPNATLPLNMAYRAIGQAEALGAQGNYLESARAHYRTALAHYGKGEMGAASLEARAASSLARAAVAERPAPLPKDVPAPPQIAALAMGSARGAWSGGSRSNGGPAASGSDGPPGHRGGSMRHRQVDAAELGALAKLENTAEAHSLADAAVNASIASQRAALAGNREEAGRQRMLGVSLAIAVRSITFADHPDLLHRGFRSRGDGAAPKTS